MQSGSYVRPCQTPKFFYAMFQRPIITASLTGLVLGDFQTGVIIGGTLELVWMGFMNIGASIPADGSDRFGNRNGIWNPVQWRRRFSPGHCYPDCVVGFHTSKPFFTHFFHGLFIAQINMLTKATLTVSIEFTSLPA